MKRETTRTEGSRRVAVVDDDAAVRRAVVNLLSSLDYPVAAFDSAEEFLKSDLEATDCLVLDIQMTGMSGLELLARIVDMGLDIAVILFTAYGDGETRRRAIELGAAAFISKPFRPEEVAQAVKSCTERRR